MAEKPVSIPGTIKWQPGRVVGGDHTGAVYLYATNRYGGECCLGKWESPEDAKGTPYESEVAEVFAAADRAQVAELGELANPAPTSSGVEKRGAVLPEAHSGSPQGGVSPEFAEVRSKVRDAYAKVQSGAMRRPACRDYELNEAERASLDKMTRGIREYAEELARALVCNGTGRKTEESDGKSNTLESRAGDQVRPGGFTAQDQRSGTSGLFPVSPLAASGQTEGTGAAERPPGIPASATIWAEVVDGLGRKVGAWFDERNGKPCVLMVDADDADSKWWWSPGNHDAWAGDHCLPDVLGPDAAAQCRQLYEKGLAHLAAEATPKPTLTAVDLTELREAMGDLDTRHNIENARKVIEAARRLLSSGGAP